TRPTQQGREISVVRGDVVALPDAGLDLAACGDVAARGCELQGLLPPPERVRDRGHPTPDGRPVLVGGRRHEVDDVADRLECGGDVVERALLLTARVELLLEAETLTHRGDGHLVDVVRGPRIGQAGEGSTAQL